MCQGDVEALSVCVLVDYKKGCRRKVVMINDVFLIEINVLVCLVPFFIFIFYDSTFIIVLIMFFFFF